MSIEVQTPQRNQSATISGATDLPAPLMGPADRPIPPTERRDWTIHPLPYRELKRRLWHMAPGLLPLILQQVSHADPLSPTLRGIIVACCLVIAGRIALQFRNIRRQGEGSGFSAVAGYSLSALVTILLFPRHLEIGLAVVSILAFGDGSATLMGLMLRGPQLPWNSAKSWSGFLGFCVVGTLMTAWVYFGETRNPEAAEPSVSFATALLIVSPAVLLSALAESLRSRVNDNIRVGVTAAVTMASLHFLVRGL